MAKISINDIAKKAGVSVSSVSLAFHRPYQLSPETKNRILAIAEEMGYTPKQIRHTKVMRNIMVAVPAGGVKSTQSHFINSLIENISNKECKAIVIYYKTQKELEIQTAALENDPLALGMVVILNEKEQYHYQASSIPTVVVSPHSSVSQYLNVGCNFVEDITDELDRFCGAGKNRVGVLIEQDKMSSDYFQLVCSRLSSKYEKICGKEYDLSLICTVKAKDKPSEKIKKFIEEQRPDAWIIVGVDVLPALLLNVNESIMGIVVIEEGVESYAVDKHDLVFLERPTSQIAKEAVDMVFDLINNKQFSTDKKVILQACKN